MRPGDKTLHREDQGAFVTKHLADADLVRATSSQLYFATGAAKLGWLFVGFSALLFWALQRPETTQSRGTFWLAISWFTVALFFVYGVSRVLWRHELHIDTELRTYRRRRGFWPAATWDSGLLGSAAAVILTREMRSGASDIDLPVWVVSLSLAETDRPTSVLIAGTETASRLALAHLARTLRLPMVDRTGPNEKFTSWKDIANPEPSTGVLESFREASRARQERPVFSWGSKTKSQPNGQTEKR
jgi:hypothetical protein